MKLKHYLAIGAVVASAAIGIVKVTKTTYHRFDISPGSYSNPVSPQPGDTINLLPGNYGYITFSNIYGTPSNKIIITCSGSVTMSNGFAFYDSRHIRISGKNMLWIKDNPNTVAINIEGKSSDFEIDHIKARNVYSLCWFKTEPTLYKDTSYWSTMIMDSLYMHDDSVWNSNFESLYIGSTDQNADRKCLANDGNYYYPYPASVRNIRLVNLFVDSSKRTGGQISGLLLGKNVIHNCTFLYSGTNKESNQGAAFRIGGRSVNITVDSCTFINSWLYAFQSQATGKVLFRWNNVDNATKLDVVNPQQMAAVEFDNYGMTTYRIRENNIGFSNNNVSVVVYGTPQTVSTNSLYYNNITTGTFQNKTSVNFKTTIK